MPDDGFAKDPDRLGPLAPLVPSPQTRGGANFDFANGAVHPAWREVGAAASPRSETRRAVARQGYSPRLTGHSRPTRGASRSG